MMERRIFLWMGLMVLFFSLSLCGPGFAEVKYKVKKGDTLAKIARQHSVSIQDLRSANQLENDTLRLKQTLVIPVESKKKASRNTAKPSTKKSYYIVKTGDTLSSVSQKTGVSVSDLKRANHLRSSTIRKGQKLALLAPAAKSDAAHSVMQKDRGQEDMIDDELDDAVEDGTDSPGFQVADVAQIDEDSSHLLGKWRSPEERSLFVKVAKGFLGAPYRLGGSSVRGLDCSAFVMKIYQLFDISLPRTAREQAHVGMRVDREELQEGDLVFFNTRRAFGHVGIYIGNNEFVHASSGKRARQVKIDSLDKPYYSKRFVKAVRLKDIEKRDDNT